MPAEAEDLLSLDGYWEEREPAPEPEPELPAGAPVLAPPTAVKIAVAGGFGVGKTTFVGAVSEIAPLTTEAAMTDLGAGVDDIALVQGKETTTVAMDFGRRTIDDGLVLYVFGTPGQERFAFMWDDVCRGSVGAVVLVDLRRITDCFGAIDYFESRRLPFVVAVNAFEGSGEHDDDEVRDALALAPGIPIVRTDARDPRRATDAMVALVEHALTRAG